METKNVWRDVIKPLEMHEDNRGIIADIFLNEDIDAISIIKSKQGVRRGDHYHKQTTQHMLMTKGSLFYVYQPVDKKQPVKFYHAKEGDLVTTKPMEVHTLLFSEDNEFIVFSSGLRSGKNYEKDTFRVEPLVLPPEVANLVSSDPKLLRQKHDITK